MSWIQEDLTWFHLQLNYQMCLERCYYLSIQLIALSTPLLPSPPLPSPSIRMSCITRMQAQATTNTSRKREAIGASLVSKQTSKVNACYLKVDFDKLITDCTLLCPCILPWTKCICSFGSLLLCYFSWVLNIFDLIVR